MTGAPAGVPLEARFEIAGRLDLRLTLGPLQHSGADPTIRFAGDAVWLTRRTVMGAATVVVRIEAEPAAGDAPDAARTVVGARAWGPGAAAALEATPELVGALDHPELLEARHPLVRELARRFAGFRMTRTGQLMPVLYPAALGQKITATELIQGYLGLLRTLGEPAPGPEEAAGMLVVPDPERVAALPYFELHRFGVERRRADLVRRLAGRAPSIERLLERSPREASAGLQTIPGVGPWTAAEAVRLAFGDPDTVSVGDAHIPDMVTWALAGEPRADDARMLEVLEPYRGQRGRVVALLEVGGIVAPRFGPRFAPGRIDRI
jgi:3-methyladenine DNA glycosylase/8-oxoguanine DNA glycosylase